MSKLKGTAQEGQGRETTTVSVTETNIRKFPERGSGQVR